MDHGIYIVHGIAKSQSDTTERLSLHFTSPDLSDPGIEPRSLALRADALPSREKAMAPHSSTLAWKIPWTEEAGGLQSMGWQRVGHDLATKP